MKKKSHSIFAVLALALVIAAAIVVFALIRKYTPSKEHEDLTTYYHLTNSDEVAIVLNNEVTSSKARVIDGHIYIDYDFVHDNLNSRFYWDNNENIRHRQSRPVIWLQNLPQITVVKLLP